MVSLAPPNTYMLPRNMNVNEESDYVLYPEVSQQLYSPEMFSMNNMQSFGLDPNAYSYPPRQAHDSYPNVGAMAAGQMYAEVPQFMSGKHSPNPFAMESPELRAPPSNLSTASGPSAPSSAMGSPYSNHGHAVPHIPEWSNQGLGINPSIVGFDNFGPQDYTFAPSGMEPDFAFHDMNKPSFVDPSLIHGYPNPTISAMGNDGVAYQQSVYPPPSPALSQRSSHSSRPIKHGSQSPYYNSYPYPPPNRRQSLASRQSYDSHEGSFDSDESREKGKCPNPECGKVFKDLKAHMLTHQNERPEKCPIATCDYHIKGFARKYDKNRHTLTHYKGTMVCGFCPGSGSAAEKSFNRADVFKRHLTSVHAVEQSPPNSRKKATAGANAGKKLAGYAPDATGKCSTCSATFSNAQDFYEHLDDCVLRIVQQEDPSEAINARRLAEVENDPAVLETLRSNNLPTTTVNTYSAEEDDEDEDFEDAEDDDYTNRPKAGRRNMKGRTSSGGIKKGLTFSKGGVTLHSKAGRKKRKDYPTAWGCPATQMKMKKRVMCAFDGSRRLWKDDMMLSTDYEVRIPLSDGKSYVTDLDVQTLKRAEAFLNATSEEKGPEFGEDMEELDIEKLMEVKSEEF